MSAEAPELLISEAPARELAPRKRGWRVAGGALALGAGAAALVATRSKSDPAEALALATASEEIYQCESIAHFDEHDGKTCPHSQVACFSSTQGNYWQCRSRLPSSAPCTSVKLPDGSAYDGVCVRRGHAQWSQAASWGLARAPAPKTFSNPAAETGKLGPQCQDYLKKKGYSNPEQLLAKLSDYHEGSKIQWNMPCQENATAQALYHPNPKPNFKGVMDTSDASCRFGNSAMHQVDYWKKDGNTCCGAKPHFNWIIATCENFNGKRDGQFCSGVPDCAKDGGAKINYMATYQFDGKEFVLMDDSTAGDLSPSGVSGDWHKKTGFEAQWKHFEWKGGDWTTKYAPWARGKGPDGPRGITPPGGLWVLSAENFYYAAFYMLHQLTLNLDGQRWPQPSGNCWLWELDPVEGSVGWHSRSKPGPGNLNQLYGTNNAQSSGCMPISYMAHQMTGGKKEFIEPKMFQDRCRRYPEEPGCKPWTGRIAWSGGVDGSQRFEQYWDQAYVFAVVLDHQGSWTYRWIPEADGSTGWKGIGRNFAARRLTPRPRKVTDPRGLETDVAGDVKEAVILQPSLPEEASCLRSSIEGTNWAFGSEALGSMASQLGAMSGSKGKFAGAQNWWAHFADTQQYQDYPTTIMGMPKNHVKSQTYTCNDRDTWSCNCKAK